ncbi:YihY/virulence factor BrkB family protein [Candidatus Saccharibacteria bacterium]|nr:YihY/virulence factor BrkB family protein [Candidatus Saccharibacteria bacterium]
MGKRRQSFWSDAAIVLGLRSLDRDLASMKWSRWKQIAYKTRVAMGDKNLGMLAAGIAYYGTLAFFPLMVLLVSVSSLFIQPDRFQETVQTLNTYLPKDIAGLVTAQLGNLLDKPVVSLSAAVIALLVALWSVSGAADNLVRALNVAYGLKESRSIFKLKRLSIYMTFLIVLILALFVPLMAVTEEWLAGIGLAPWVITLIAITRWLVLIGVVMAAIDVLYKIAPAHARRFRWVSWGSLVATGLWVAVTALFFVYVRYFANFSDSYSLFAGIIILMIWLNLSALSLLLGATVGHLSHEKSA